MKQSLSNNDTVGYFPSVAVLVNPPAFAGVSGSVADRAAVSSPLNPPAGVHSLNYTKHNN